MSCLQCVDQRGRVKVPISEQGKTISVRVAETKREIRQQEVISLLLTENPRSTALKIGWDNWEQLVHQKSFSVPTSFSSGPQVTENFEKWPRLDMRSGRLAVLSETSEGMKSWIVWGWLITNLDSPEFSISFITSISPNWTSGTKTFATRRRRMLRRSSPDKLHHGDTVSRVIYLVILPRIRGKSFYSLLPLLFLLPLPLETCILIHSENE